jgi:hypothetical protein
VAVLVLAACGGSSERTASEPLRGRAPASLAATPASSPTVVEWEAARWPALGLGFASLRGSTPELTPWDGGGGVAMQAVQRGEYDRARWLLRTAADESLDGFRDDHQSWTMSPGPWMSVCGQRVRSVVATHDAEDITCVMTPTGNHPAWIPPRRAVALELVHRGLHVVVSFESESKQPETWRAAEAAFFAALRCW